MAGGVGRMREGVLRLRLWWRRDVMAGGVGRMREEGA